MIPRNHPRRPFGAIVVTRLAKIAPRARAADAPYRRGCGVRERGRAALGAVRRPHFHAHRTRAARPRSERGGTVPSGPRLIAPGLIGAAGLCLIGCAAPDFDTWADAGMQLAGEAGAAVVRVDRLEDEPGTMFDDDTSHVEVLATMDVDPEEAKAELEAAGERLGYNVEGDTMHRDGSTIVFWVPPEPTLPSPSHADESEAEVKTHLAFDDQLADLSSPFLKLFGQITQAIPFDLQLTAARMTTALPGDVTELSVIVAVHVLGSGSPAFRRSCRVRRGVALVRQRRSGR